MLLLFACLGVSCDGGGSPVEAFYSDGTNSIVVEIDFMPEAEPYIEETEWGVSIWDFFRSHLEALVGPAKTVTVPRELSEMERVDAGDGKYTADEILALADVHRQFPAQQGATVSLYILFLDGFYVVDGEERAEVLGVSLGDSGVIAIFKPALTDFVYQGQVQIFTEQSVLIHETGHALGLVDNGVPMVSDHQDEEHFGHCSNPHCVMYWANEGGRDLLEFLARQSPSVDSVLFGEECLADVHAFSR